jgi:prepilin-type N-terminal cleavage/methylation domain-containing protein
MRNNRYKNGFTFIEVLFAVLLVGLAIASLMAANAAFTRANGIGTDLSTAEFLIGQIKELTILLPVIDPETELATFGPESGETLADYDDLDDFNDATFSPPINAERTVLSEFSAYSQKVTVQNVNASNFEQVVANHSSNFVRVTVQIYLNSVPISSANWLRARY